MAKTFDGPPTLERSGSELRRAVSSLSPEGERVGVRGGALFKGKEGRGDFRKDTPIYLWVIEVVISYSSSSRRSAKFGTMVHKEPLQDNISRNAYFSISSGSISLPFLVV